MASNELGKALGYIFEGIKHLQNSFPDRKFTIDGRLVGDIGEVIAAQDFEIILDKTQKPTRDGVTFDGREVQIKATFKDSLTFRTVPELYLGIKLRVDGSYEVIYNGPPDHIVSKYKHRTGFGQNLLSFPTKDLSELSARIPDGQRIKLRR